MAGNPQFRIRRKVATLDIVENQIKGYPLEIGQDIESIHLEVNAVLDVTAAATSVRAEAPTQLIKRVELVADGKDTIHSTPFVFLTHANAFRHAKPPITPPSGVAINTYAVQAKGNLDNIFPDGVRPKDTSLQSRNYGSLRLRLTFGAAADCFVGGTVSLTSGTVDVYVTETVELTAQGQQEKRLVRKTSYLEQDIASSNTNLQILLPTGNQVRAVIIRAEDAGEPSNGIINNIKMYSGVDVRMDMTGDHLRSINAEDYGAFGNSGMPTGIYVADLCHEGRLTNAWDLRGVTQAFLSLDVTSLSANSKIYVEPVELIG